MESSGHLNIYALRTPRRGLVLSDDSALMISVVTSSGVTNLAVVPQSDCIALGAAKILLNFECNGWK